MSRELKFRWFDKDAVECGEQGMIYSDNLPSEYMVTFGKEGFQLLVEGADCDVLGVRYNDIECEPMQYTGLKDSNGKEIYENDIVYFTYPQEPHNTQPNPFRGKVEYVEEVLAFRVTNDMGLEEPIHPDIELRVLGNIYENAELLKVG